MRRLMTSVALCAALVTGLHAEQARPLNTRDVELDVSVVDRDGRPVTDLQQNELQVSDDGNRVEITSFSRVSVLGNDSANARTIAIILDDAGVPMEGTPTIQALASMVMSGLKPADNVVVLPLHGGRSDVATPNHDAARVQIATFHAGVTPFVQNETTEDLLQEMSRIARQWAKTIPHRRTAVVCIGSPGLCNIIERDPTAPRDMFPNWVEALETTARAHTVFYALVPARISLMGGSLVERTGGELFSSATNFDDGVRRLFQDLSEYYLVGYRSTTSLSKPIHSVSVRTTRRDTRVRTRQQRGN
jgi:hypothetical protein